METARSACDPSRRCSCRRTSPSRSGRALSRARAHPHEAEPRGAEQVLEDAGRERVDAELLHVDRIRAGGLVGVEEHERAVLLADPRDLLGGQPRAVAVADGRDRDDRGALVDRALDVLRRDDVHLRTAQLLRVPDLADRRELVVADHDLRPLREVDRTRERADACRERRRDRDVVGLRVHEPREGRARRLVALDPVVPRRAALVPADEVLLVGGAHGIGERALRARVDVDEPLEDREALATRADGANGQGTPS